ncbi:MAG TPA: FAD-binding oxidoreductase [Thermoanaerobaculia bacterium]|nr:FAD-binding oxidoreductase [Thermoanaerobaculia bacterium]
MPAPPQGESFGAAELVSFDGGVRERVCVSRPNRDEDVRLPADAGPRSCLGGGFSYAPAGFGGGAVAIDHRRFDRILSFDAETGEIECEAGAMLGAIHAFLGPKGFFLPVQPGYPGITIGGCIAADVHGKNQYRDGTFRAHVRSLRLFHPRYGEVEASREGNTEAFDLTCGGLGLTGSILSAKLRASRLPARRIEMTRRPLPAFAGVLEALERAAGATDFLYSWHDVTRSGPSFGRGFLVEGRFAEDGRGGVRPEPEPRWNRLTAESRGRAFPPLLNCMTAAPFNRAWNLVQRLGPARTRVGVFGFLFPVARKVAYFHLFGRRGFHEMQWIVPRPAVQTLSRDLPALLRRRRAPVTLASCKLFRGVPSLARFDGEGLCLALDFPRDASSASLAAELDRLGMDLGAVPNVGKDSRLPPEVARAGLPGLEEFRNRLRRWDPDRLYRSALSERLEL